MAAERKLKGEIDRTLKKIQEGQELFEELWNQAHDCENSNQREKLEGELKKEIKKLQRLREQIKAWIAGADIKDKQPLMDARKSIERDMERFKACERESKIKGINRVYNDPKEKAKEDARDWINSTVDALTTKIEEHEYEIEELQGALKKKQKPPPRMAELEETVTQYKLHVDHLEKVLRCIDNEAIQPDELEDLKNDFESYLNPDEDGYGDFLVEDMYASFMDRMEAVDHAAPMTAVVKHAAKGKEKEEADREREREKERERERAAAAAAKAQLIAQGNTSLKLDEEELIRKGTPPAAPAATGRTTTAKDAEVLTTATSGLPTTPRGPAAAAPSPLQLSTQSSMDGALPGIVPRASPAPAPGFPAPVAPPPVVGAAQQPASHWLSVTAGQNGHPDAPGFPQLGVTTGPVGQQGPPPPPIQATAGKIPVGKLQQGAAAVAQGTTAPPTQQFQSPIQKPPAPPPRAGTDGADGQQRHSEDSGRPAADGSAAETLAGKAVSADGRGGAGGDGLAGGRQASATPAPPEVLNLQPVAAPFTLQAARQILESCFQRAMPQPSDTEWKRYKPRHPAAVPASFPRTQHDVVENPALFRRLDPECLFFAFYFQPSMYQQYLAAHELKRQSWRFHMHHSAWFQRFTEPTVTSDEYEQGAYVYFDYNIVHDDLQTGWCYRRKENFTFRYDALEDELRVQQ